MPRRTGHFLGLAGSVALAMLLALALQPGLAAHPQSGMSAPFDRAPALASSHNASLLPSHFDWHVAGSSPARLAFTFTAVRAGYEARTPRHAGAPHYGPVYRRPPPSLS